MCNGNLESMILVIIYGVSFIVLILAPLITAQLGIKLKKEKNIKMKILTLVSLALLLGNLEPMLCFISAHSIEENLDTKIEIISQAGKTFGMLIFAVVIVLYLYFHKRKLV